MSPFDQLARPLLLAAGVCFLLALPFELASTVLSDQPFVEVAQSPAHAAAAALAMAAFVLLGLAVPGLASRRGTRSHLGTTAAVLAVLGAFAGGTLQWYIAVVIPWQARSSAPELAGDLGGLGFYVLIAAFAVGIIALGVGCLRSGVVSRPAGALILLGGLCAPLSPAFMTVTGVALVVAGRSVAESHQVEPVLV